MRRGFKTEAKNLARELRGELGLDADCPFDPYAFANLYGIQVVKLSSLKGAARDRFLMADGSALSGALIPIGTGLVILENDAQLPGRCRTTMCHELAHVVLEHPFSVAIEMSDRKCGLGKEQEDEADWLAGEMLIPYDGALRMARMKATDRSVATTFDVSLAVARWRMNQSGARKVVERTQARRQR